MTSTAGAVLSDRTVLDVMTSSVHVASPHTPIKLLALLMEENKVSAIPIVDERGIPIGVVSEVNVLRHELLSARDLLDPPTMRLTRSNADGIVASEVMTSPPVTVRSDITLIEAERLMEEHRVKRLIVVDVGGRIVGIVSGSDLLLAHQEAR